MGLLTHTVFSMPEALTEMLIIAAVIALFVGGHAIVQRTLKPEFLRRHNDVAGYLFSAVGVLYAVVLGFVVVVVWQKYDDTVANVENEVAALADAYHATDGFPEPARTIVRSTLYEYVDHVISVEWPALTNDKPVPESGTVLLEKASYETDSFAPATARESNAQQAAMTQMSRLFDARRQRLIHAAPLVPDVLWAALVIGALAMVTFCYLFGVENRPAQLVMTALLVGLMAILFAVIAEFAGPFSGSVSISDDGWIFLQQRLHNVK